MFIDNGNTNTTDNFRFLEYSEISTSFPNEWILIANPVVNENSVIVKGIVLFHSKDKKEVCYIGRDKTSNFEKITLIYTGTFKSARKITGIFNRIAK